MRRFFAGNVPVSYPDYVLIFRHVYNQNRPERAWRDHDNIEVNIVADVIALYLLPAVPTTIAVLPGSRNGQRCTLFPVKIWGPGYMPKKPAD